MKSRLLLLLVLLVMSTGCAFAGIGAGVGSAFPKTALVTEPEQETLGEQPATDLEKEHVPEVRKRKGNHWLTGFLVGGAVDLVLSGVLAYFAVQSFGSGLSAMGAM